MSNLGTNEWWRRPLQKPRQLTRGDRVAVVTPCWGGPATFPARYEAGKRFLADRFGLEVVETAHALAEPDWIDANPAARADDLMQAFHDPAIKGIIASIGGDDAVRLIPCIDLAVIRDNPKLFVGYSDLTVISGAEGRPAVPFACRPQPPLTHSRLLRFKAKARAQSRGRTAF